MVKPLENKSGGKLRSWRGQITKSTKNLVKCENVMSVQSQKDWTSLLPRQTTRSQTVKTLQEHLHFPKLLSFSLFLLPEIKIGFITPKPRIPREWERWLWTSQLGALQPCWRCCWVSWLCAWLATYWVLHFTGTPWRA